MTIAQLRALSTSDALEACNKLDAATRRKLFVDCPPSDHRILLVLNVVDRLVMEDGFSGGISGMTSNVSGAGMPGDYGVVRTFILKQLAIPANSQKAAAAKDECWRHWFYPEFRAVGSPRERLARIAEAHVKLDAYRPLQVPIFSLNGYFDWNKAMSSSHVFSTCGLFVRACRAAARLLEKRSWATNTPSGTDPCVVGPNSKSSAVHYSSRGDREPKRGDIFDVATPGQNNHHVGIILQHRRETNGDWMWRTAEGGQGKGYETLLFEERLLKFRNGQHWHPGNGSKARPLVKWIDTDRLAAAIA